MAGIDPQWPTTVEHWARRQPEICRAWLFGSRVRGANRHDSDLDVAIELLGEDGERLAIWIGESADWKTTLQSLMNVTVHLELADPVNTPDRVWPAVQEHGIKVFDRAELT